MPAPAYAAQFMLVDPTKLAETHSVEQSVVMTVTGLVQGSIFDLNGLTARAGSQLMNQRLSQLTRYKTHAAAVMKAATAVGGLTMILRYCSQCGRRFKTNVACEHCGIAFVVSSEVEFLPGRLPDIPPKIVAYAKQHGHTFTHEPPRP